MLIQLPGSFNALIARAFRLLVIGSETIRSVRYFAALLATLLFIGRAALVHLRGLCHQYIHILWCGHAGSWAWWGIMMIFRFSAALFLIAAVVSIRATEMAARLICETARPAHRSAARKSP